ncbi:MAG: RagB/SusD family nutrient uptake outer membrane protein [Bacteroidales bacterium]|nr:RagB/SusD family nutrient uptake outer membrane protein [Bacteroidales bacterium]
MKKRILYILFPLLLASCSFLDEKNTTYATSDYYTSPERIVTGLNGCYDPVRSIYSAAMLQMTECATDVMFLSSYTRPDANCVISPAKPCHGKTVWKQGYLGVMRTNELCNVINRTLEEGKITEDEYAVLYGEAAVMRAMYYYVLTSVFGDVPFYLEAVTEENRKEIAHLERTLATVIRDTLANELLDILLPYDRGGKQYMPLVRSYASGTDYRAGASMGLMLAVKFCMWNERWEDAITACEVLEDIYGHFADAPSEFGQTYPLTDIPFSNKWTPESIFEISNKVEEFGQQEYSSIASYCTPSRSNIEIEEDDDETDESASVVSNNYNGIIIPEMSAYARTYKAARPTKYFHGTLMKERNKDLRAGEYTESDVPRGGSGNLAWRWKGYSAESDLDQERDTVMFFNSCTSYSSRPWLGNKFWCPTMYYNRDSNNQKVFRFAGVLLNKAEALLMTGDFEEACRYLSITKVRAGLDPVQPITFSYDADLIMEEIRKECAVELFGEFQRKFDLVRWGIWYERTLQYNNSYYLPLYIKPYHKYYPVPSDQVAYSDGALNNNDYME